MAELPVNFGINNPSYKEKHRTTQHGAALRYNQSYPDHLHYMRRSAVAQCGDLLLFRYENGK